MALDFGLDKYDCYQEPDAESYQMDSERVMREIQRLYRSKDIGLKDTASCISERNFRITIPRQKITVLIVGNHNAAKQKFLDLYFSDSRQVAGGGFISRVDYDKLDKIYITHGNQRKVLTGESVLDYCPHLAQLKNVPGLKDYLTTEIASRNTKSLVSFILAPERIPVPSVGSIHIGSAELTDGNNKDTIIVTPTNTRKRSLDMRHTIGKLTEAADLIFIFFDPTGIVSPRETLQPFEHLWQTHHEKMLLLLAKTREDECQEETREDVLVHIIREIWRNPVVKRVGYLPEIYCPDLTSGIRDDERLWNVIQTSADESVDKALLQLEQDATNIREKLESVRKRNEKAKYNTGPPTSFYFWGIVFFVILAGIWGTQYDELLCKATGKDLSSICKEIVANKACILTVGVMAIYYVVYTLIVDSNPTVLSEEEERLLEQRIQFANHALYKKEVMEKSYIGMSMK